MFEPLRNLVSALGVDPTFTNRSDIWRFAFSAIVERPFTGYGLQSFWQTDALVYSGGAVETWAVAAYNEHNGYLDALISLGILGLIITVAWAVLIPIGHIAQAQRADTNPALTQLFIRIWLYIIITACVESVFCEGGGALWFCLLFALFGLRLQGAARLVSAGDERPAAHNGGVPMFSLCARIDDLAGRLTNRLIERLPGPQIVVPATTPIVSFAFNDVPDTALSAGAAILERYDARGTFCISGGLTGQREAGRTLISADGCAELLRRGHKLGCRAFAHPNLRHQYGDAPERDIARNQAFLAGLAGGRRPTNFAYPYNAGSFRARALLARTFRSARGGLSGINRGLTDRTYLHGMPIQQPEASVLALRDVVDDLVANPG
ncbi:MAG: polysaccharide deacetylase family protein [Candidatus Devosia euplotis]|nr:polysaccharide deacetylase family protein [Candidatus Devosia euplotis]